MCGIYGILALRPGGPPETGALRRMAAVTVHRGPDDEGAYTDANVLLGMRRLSIIDVGGGHQPISNENGTLHVVCNGEIYNFSELTAELVRAGHTFKTRSDTEVLLHLYEEHGDEFVTRVSGMFAFALWDAPRRRLLIGRDRLGIKPLYYREEGRRLLFASEAKAILAASDLPVELDPVALQQYLTLGYPPAPRSMFQGVRKLPAASLMVCEREQVTLRRFWTPALAVDDSPSEGDWVDAFRATMQRAVVSQMVSDVPLGAFLSGGIDSSTIVAHMASESRQPIKTYSIGFGGDGAGAFYNELPWARRVADRFQTDHHEILVKPDVVALLPRLLWHMDEPVADSAFVTTYLVSELARRDVTVILSGVGGDELFGGYRRYLGVSYDRYYRMLPRWLRSGVLPSVARLLPSDRHSAMMNLSRQLRTYVLSQDQPFEQRYRSYVQVFGQAAATELLRDPPAEVFDALETAFRDAARGDGLARLTRVDLLTQLPDDLLLLTDKMTMATSLECRVPWLDDAVLDLALRMPSRFKIRGRQLKHVLKRALAPLLPPEILHRKKRGFGAPMGAWLKGELAPLMRHTLSQESVEKRGLFRWEAVHRTIALHETNREDHSDHLQALTNLELWCRMYLDGRSAEDVTAELAGARRG
jgi:asparagine synthase (glutamine-hydrolysing)